MILCRTQAVSEALRECNGIMAELRKDLRSTLRITFRTALGAIARLGRLERHRGDG